jgi:rhodanese-related sulfurtransferase
MAAIPTTRRQRRRTLAAGGPGTRSGGRHRIGESLQREIDEALLRLVPHDTFLSPSTLGRVTAAFAARPELFEGLVVQDPELRWHLKLSRRPGFDLWVLAWQPGQETDWHDHGGSSGSFAVVGGRLLERYRRPGTRTVAGRELAAGAVSSFGPSHVHNVGYVGDAPATSIHAYSPPLAAMTYYESTAMGLVARETIPVDSPEGPGRNRSGHRRLPRPIGSTAGGENFGAKSIDQLLAAARVGLERLGPEGAARALEFGAALVDIRPPEQRRLEGEVPGAVIIPRNVLEWRLDPQSEARLPDLARYDRQIIIFCSEGYASSLAAVALRQLGLSLATDLDGGFRAWKAAGLPTKPAE